jgi:hypothetical protein
VIIDYDLVDILSSELVETSRIQYSYIYAGAQVQLDAEIIIPAGLKIIITRASRFPRGLDLYGFIDMTEEAKAALETKVAKFTL